MGSKMRTESIYDDLNRSARPGSAASRALIESWMKSVPAAERASIRLRFRSGNDVQFASAMQELTMHELLRRQRCKLRFHPNVPGTTKQPDFKVKQPGASDFLLEACVSTNIASGPQGGQRANRLRDFLERLDLKGYVIAIDQLTEGSNDLSQRLLARHIEDGIGAAAVGYAPGSISIPPLSTADGWNIRLTAFPTSQYGVRGSTVMQEAWGRTWNGSSDPLLDSLKKKGSRYSAQLTMPYVIAVNSLDVMRTDHDFQKTLFGDALQSNTAPGSRSFSFWGTAKAPTHRRVSAVLFTTNLWPATLLMGQVYACIYLNPWANQPYAGILTRLPTFRFENGTVVESGGVPLHTLLKLRTRDSSLWRQ
jgi:hypothetical protein